MFSVSLLSTESEINSLSHSIIQSHKTALACRNGAVGGKYGWSAPARAFCILTPPLYLGNYSYQ